MSQLLDLDPGLHQPDAQVSATEASKVFELRDEVMNLYNDLKAIKEEPQLTFNTYLLNQIVYKMPRKYQETFSIKKEGNMADPASNLY